MNYKTKKLLEVLEYSEAMMENAEAGLWEKVFEAETKRSDTLKEVFFLPFTKQEKLENNLNIQRILKINKKLEAVTSRARDEVKKEVSSISKGRHAVGMYAQNTG